MGTIKNLLQSLFTFRIVLPRVLRGRQGSLMSKRVVLPKPALSPRKLAVAKQGKPTQPLRHDLALATPDEPTRVNSIPVVSDSSVRSRFDRNNVIQFVGLVLLIPAVGLMLTLLPSANPVIGNAVSAGSVAEEPSFNPLLENEPVVDPSGSTDSESSLLSVGQGTEPVDDPYIPPSDEEVADAADSIVVLAPADRPPALVVAAPPAGSGSGGGATSSPAPPAANPGPTPTPNSGLAAPTGVTASNDNTRGIDVRWNSVSGASGYHLFRGRGTAKPAYYKTITGRSSFGDDPNAGTYRYYVAAVDGSRVSPASATTEPITVGDRVSTPRLTGVQGSDGLITFTPSPQGADKHNVYRDGDYLTTTKDGGRFTIQQIRGSHTYYFVGVEDESYGFRFSARSDPLTFTW